MIMRTLLPEGLTMRPALLGDIESIYDLSRAYDLAHTDEEEYSLDDIQAIWTGPGLNLAEDSRLVFDKAGQLIGFLLLQQQRYAKFYVGMRILPGYSDPRP